MPSTILGRAPLEAGPAWDEKGNVKPVWARWFNGETTETLNALEAVQSLSNIPLNLLSGQVSQEALVMTVIGLLASLQRPVQSTSNKSDVPVPYIYPKSVSTNPPVLGPIGLTAQGILTLLQANGILFDGAGNVEFTGNIKVDGNARVVTALEVDTTSDLKGAVHCESSLQVDTTSDLKGNVHCEGTIQVDSTSDLKGAVHCEASLQVDTTSDLKGNVLCEGTLTVNGTSDLKSPVTAELGVVVNLGGISCTGNVNVTGLIHASSTIEAITGFIANGIPGITATVALAPLTALGAPGTLNSRLGVNISYSPPT